MDSVGGDSVGATGVCSEEYFAHACDTCKQDGIEKKADVYCPTCEENLCSRCLEWHTKLKATRTHEVQPVSSGGGQVATSEQSDTAMRSFATMCTCNQKCDVNEFCKEHKMVVCSTCASVKHRSCKIASIDEMCRDESVVKTFNLTTEKVDDLAKKASEIKSHQNSCLIDLQETETRCKTEIRNCKTDMMKWIEKLETNALADLQTIIGKQMEILQNAGTSAENASALLKVDQKLLENANKSQNKRQMFISNIQVEQSLEHYEGALSEAERTLQVPDIEFEKNKKLSAFRQESEQLGRVKTREAERKRRNENENFVGYKPTYCTSVGVNQPGDGNNPRISGIAFLLNGDLLIADRKNSRLTLLDPAFKIKDSLKCSESSNSPWDIAVISDTEVVVTLPDCKTLQFYHIFPKLQVDRNIKLDCIGKCRGVTVGKDFMFVSCTTPEILVLDTKGNRLKSIAPSQLGIRVQGLSYIALNRSGNRLYYSDFSGNKLICMTIDGKNIYTYTDPDLKHPRDLIVADDDDNVLIAGEDSNNIHLVKANGTRHSVLLTSGDGIQKPMSISYNSTTKTLVVGEWDRVDLKIFNLK